VADRLKLLVAGDDLRCAAANARLAARELAYIKRQLLLAVGEAEAQGFEVTEALAVRDLHPSLVAGPVRQAEAEAFAADITSKAALLLAADQEVANAITTAVAGLGGLVFPESPGTTQALDQPLGPPIGEGGGTSGADVRAVIDKLPQGDKPWIREVRTPQDLERLWQWAKQNGVEVPNAYGDPSKGTAIRLPDGTQIGQRYAAGSTGTPAVDIKMPGERGNTKVHINPRGGVPEFPSIRPAMEAPRLPPPAEPPPLRFGGAPAADFFPQIIEPRHSGDTDLPVVGDGKPDRPEF